MSEVTGLHPDFVAARHLRAGHGGAASTLWLLLLLQLLAGCGGEYRRTCDEAECRESCVAGGATSGRCVDDVCQCRDGGDGDADGDRDRDDDADRDDGDVEDGVDPCEGEDCSGHGDCMSGVSGIWCACNPGYHAEGMECLPDAPDGDADLDVDLDIDSGG